MDQTHQILQHAAFSWPPTTTLEATNCFISRPAGTLLYGCQHRKSSTTAHNPSQPNLPSTDDFPRGAEQPKIIQLNHRQPRPWLLKCHSLCWDSISCCLAQRPFHDTHTPHGKETDLLLEVSFSLGYWKSLRFQGVFSKSRTRYYHWRGVGGGTEYKSRWTTLFFLLSKFNTLRQAPLPSREPQLGARLGSAGPGVLGDAESGRVSHTHPLLTTITTLGVGPLTSRCTMPNRWLYIFESPQDGGGVRRGFPTAATCETSFRDAEIWLPWCASRGEGQVGGAEVGPITMVTRRRHWRLPPTAEELSLRGLHPALGQASGQPCSLPLGFIRIAEKGLLNPKWRRRSNYTPTDFAIYIL